MYPDLLYFFRHLFTCSDASPVMIAISTSSSACASADGVAVLVLQSSFRNST